MDCGKLTIETIEHWNHPLSSLFLSITIEKSFTHLAVYLIRNSEETTEDVFYNTFVRLQKFLQEIEESMCTKVQHYIVTVVELEEKRPLTTAPCDQHILM